MPSKPATTITPTVNEDAVRARAYLMWEADGKPFGRDEHYWGLALTEMTAEQAKPKRAAATSVASEKKSKPKASAPAAAKAKSKKK
jgi:hypothetical protein